MAFAIFAAQNANTRIRERHHRSGWWCSAPTATAYPRIIHMKTILLLLLIVVATDLPLHGGVDTGQPVGGTPYDSYLSPMRQTYARFGGASPSISDVRSQLRTAHR